MALFGKKQKAEGWLAVRIHADGVSAARIRRQPGSKPAVEAVFFHAADEAARSHALERLGKEAAASRYECSCLLAAGEYHILSVEAPNVPAEELKTAIRWRLKDMLDFHVNDATIDVLDVPTDKNAPTRARTMYAIAAHNRVIQGHQDLFTQSKFPLSVIDIPEMAQRNIATLIEPEGRGLAMLSFDAESGLLTMSYGGELYLSRRIDLSYPQLMQAGEEERNGYFDRITLELQRSFDHFDRQFHFISLARLLLAPTGAEIPGLQPYLAANLYLPVENIDLDDVFDLSHSPDLRSREQQQRYFLTLGAALRLEEKAL